MKKLHALVLATACVATGGALAQQMDASLHQRSTEMMIPPALASTILGPAAPRMVTPAALGEAERRAAEAIARADMMRPQLGRDAEHPLPVTRAATVAQGGDDRRMAEIIRRTDQMRPD